MNSNEETILRESIRSIIRHVKSKRLDEEKELRQIIQKMMDLQDIKIYSLNGFSLTMSFTEIETALKIILLLVTIGYTVTKWYGLKNKDN